MHMNSKHVYIQTRGRFDMIELLEKTLLDFKSPARDVSSSITAERRICKLDCNV